METWKAIPSLSGRYEASTKGNFRKTDTELVRKLGVGTNGYLGLTVKVGLKNKTFAAHRLIAETFLGFEKGKDVNHKDGNKQNNCVENLEWLTRSENQKHAHSKLPRKIHKNTMSIVLEKDGKVSAFNSQKEAANFLGARQGDISHAIHRAHKCRGHYVYAF